MTDKLRAAMQAALDALEDLHQNHGITCAGTLSKLRAALAETEQEPKIKHTLCGGPRTVQTRVYIDDTLVSEITEPYDRLRAALAEPKNGLYLTVVYRDIQSGQEYTDLCRHPKVSAVSWSHAIDDSLRDRADARRYRWLQDGGNADDSLLVLKANPEEWDALIDAAMEATHD